MKTCFQNIGGNDLNTSTCPANALNSKEQHLGLCGKQKVAHQQHQTKGRTISSDIDIIQESVAMVTTPADVIRLPQHKTIASKPLLAMIWDIKKHRHVSSAKF
ncbi:hypothetical protein Tco_0257450 [Tanacetum coccineum]